MFGDEDLSQGLPMPPSLRGHMPPRQHTLNVVDRSLQLRRHLEELARRLPEFAPNGFFGSLWIPQVGGMDSIAMS